MFNLVSLVAGAGYIGLFAIVYAETGLLIGLLLPGDSLLFTAGLLASQGHLNIVAVCAFTAVGAMLGDNTGYFLGRRFGPTVFSREGSVLLNPSQLVRAQTYFDRYGSKTLILARFIPIIRTLAPTMAGVGRMRYRTFLLFSVISGVLWGVGVPCAGYFLGSRIPGIDHYIVPVIALIILVSIAPGVYHLLRDAENRAQLKLLLRKLTR